MPAMIFFGRKWLAATDDLVYPGLLEMFIRVVWLILIGIACIKYYEDTWNCRIGGEFVRLYFLGELIILSIKTILLLFIVRQSAKGSIMDVQARKYVEPLLTAKILMLLPEIVWNILGSIWIFGKSVECSYEHYTVTVVQTLVCFDWIQIGLAILGLALIYDPLGSLDKKKLESVAEHGKVSKNWIRRFKFLWWMRKDKNVNESFHNVAELMSNIFRGTNFVPSDVITGLILLRVHKKYETHELRRLGHLIRPEYTCDANVIFADAPSGTSLENAYRYMKFSIASYGWLFVLYQHICTGCFHLIRNLTCCICLRRKSDAIKGDNCCRCYLAGVKYLSDLSEDDILYACFENHICQMPFCVIADHKTKSIVIVIRGSMSMRDLITDLTVGPEIFECEGLPPGSTAHKGMATGAKIIVEQLNESKVLEKSFITYPDYRLIITGHSLGAGAAVLLGLLLRPRYPDLRVYAFSTPGSVLSRGATRVTEEFVLTIGLGDDLMMRINIESVENIRTSIMKALQACRLPKYRVVLNGFAYALFGVPEKDLNRTWKNQDLIKMMPVESPLLNGPNTIIEDMESTTFEKDITKRRFGGGRLFNTGKILHIVQCKPETKDGKSKKRKKKERKYEMRWVQTEELTELSVMPRMFLDHLPENLENVIKTLLDQQKNLPFCLDP